MRPPHDKQTANHPPYIFIRFDHVIPERIRNSIFHAWDLLQQIELKAHVKNDSNRSKTPAMHLGTWEVYRSMPIITVESRDQHPTVIHAIDKVLSLVGDFIAPKVRTLLQRYAPMQWLWQQRYVHDIIKHVTCIND